MLPKKPPFVSAVPANTGFGQPSTSGAEAKSPEGAFAKFQPTIPTSRQKIDALEKRHCITTMTNCGKSLEELQIADKNGAQAGAGDGVKSDDKMESADDIRAICEKIKKLEAHCEAMKEENVALKAQIGDCMKRSNVQDQENSALAIPAVWSPMHYSNSPWRPYEKSEQSLSHEEKSKKQDNRKLIAVNDIPDSPSTVRKKSNKPSRASNVGSSHLSRQKSGEIRMVVGQAVNPDPLPTVPAKPVTRWLFVTRFARSVTEDHIRDYMARKLSTKRRPVCIGLTRPNDNPSKVASFRVELLVEEFEEALDPKFWDKGVLVSEFRFPNKRKSSRSSVRSAT